MADTLMLLMAGSILIVLHLEKATLLNLMVISLNRQFFHMKQVSIQMNFICRFFPKTPKTPFITHLMAQFQPENPLFTLIHYY